MNILTAIWNFVYYTCVNLCYYRKSRLEEWSKFKSQELEDIKSEVTSRFLDSVGLKIVEESKNNIPWYIPLSRKQKDWIKTVNDKGFKVGLK